MSTSLGVRDAAGRERAQRSALPREESILAHHFMSEESLITIKDLTWPEVFSLWRNQEASLPHWIEHYKEKGYTSWDAWRQHTIQELHPERLSWTLYEILDPLKTISDFVGGPFRSWQKYYGGERIKPFRDIVDHPDFFKSETIEQMINHFPNPTTLIGLWQDDHIVVIEGLHRAAAFTLAAKEGISITSKVFIALATHVGEIPEMGQPSSPAA